MSTYQAGRLRNKSWPDTLFQGLMPGSIPKYGPSVLEPSRKVKFKTWGEIQFFCIYAALGWFNTFKTEWLIWKITRDSVRHKFSNETSRRINCNLWNHLTIDANKQTDFELVTEKHQSDLVSTRYLWNHWITSIPARAQSEQINELVSVIMNTCMTPQRAVKYLNDHFITLNSYFGYLRVSLFLLLQTGRCFW